MSVDHDEGTTNRPPGHSALPYEPGSPAEVLAATHLFMVELVKLSDAPWAKGKDGLEHRTQRMELRLREPLKGALDVAPGGTFEVDAPQHREGALETSDFHGFWSHAEVRAGQRYLVVASGAPPARTLMQEPAIQALLPETLADDVRAATAAEHDLRAARGGDAAQRAAVLKVLDRAYAERTRLRGLYARYVWARTERVYAADQDRLFPIVVKIVAASDATLEMRQAFIEGLYQASVDMGVGPARRAEIVRPLLALLLQPEAAPLVERLAQVQLYNLIFQDGSPVAAAGAVVPDPGERDRMKTALTRHPSRRADALAAWLDR